MGFTVRGYGRSSTDHQVLSTEQQESVLLDQFRINQQTKDEWRDAVWGGFFRDDDSCSFTTFREREAGSIVLALSIPGDHVMVSNFDRMFARPMDAYETIEVVRERNIHLDILDMPVDISSDLGEAFFIVMAAFKGLEVKNTRRRVRKMAQHRINVGLPMGRCPIGFKIVSAFQGGRIRKYYQKDQAVRRFAENLLANHPRHRGFDQAAQYANSCGSRQLNGRRWTRDTYEAWIKAAQQGFPLPNGLFEPAPIPADAEPVELQSFSACD